MNKNNILWIELVFALVSILVLFIATSFPEAAMLTLRIYVLCMIVVTLTLVVAVRYYQSQHSSVDIDRICEMVRRINMPAFIWSDDLTTMYTNHAMDELLGIDESDDPGDNAVLLSNFFHSIGLSPRDASEVMNGQTYVKGMETEDGIRHFNWITSLLKQGKSASLYFSIGFETTALMRTQIRLSNTAKDLQISESRYALSMKLSGIGILLCETARDEYFVSNEARAFLGTASNSITFAEFRKKLHPDDRLLFDDYLGKIRATRPDAASSRPRSLELRIRPRPGLPYVWYSYHYHENLGNADGTPIIGGALIDITGEKIKDATIERLAFLDEITEIANRNKLMHDGEETYRICKTMNTSCWIMILDIDRFHIINDTCGYENGDKILRSFAHILCKYAAAGGFAARVSADNFALVIHDYSDFGDENLPVRTLGHIRSDMAQLATGEFANIALSCSAGFARIPDDGQSFTEVLEHAEFALAMGKGELSYMMGYDAHMHQEILHQGEMEKALAGAIEQHHLCLYYQPKVDLHTQKIMGAEALIRWIKPDGTMISPNVFIPIAEKTGMISDISRFVLREACRQNAFWQQLGLSPIVMSINFASGDFYQANVCETVREELEKAGMDAKWLELELTERLALGDVNYTVQQMNALREMGILLAMDDFGTGYSSLSYIQLLPLTLLKLDRSFIIEIETDTVAQEIVSAVIKIAKSMDIETIAEGVEFKGQAAMLKEMGCDYIQGYLYGKPMTAEDFQRRLEINTYGKIIS
ncbi:MAG: bifunctional diguanylate cyclase/phosphodiesterase [Oscillospiraceae bacterium]|nr:bifunctional diguanylate cyclase/phosphodiesterase [Oscillospiraceae bacterium]